MSLPASVLVANRGEIAVRVMRTCRALGIRTVAVYSDADVQALHVRAADAAYRIGPGPAAQSYLDLDAILAATRASGAEAIHPGYGFLSENASFAAACQAAGLLWIGPPPAAMRALGDKAPAKALAERVGVPVLPGFHGAEQDADFLAARAAEIGFPVLIKASAGGGGRGMRVVEQAADFGEALAAAQREAVAAFGDGRVLLERYVTRPRHVELQVLADAHGNVVALGERECSVQRRHQKLIEETPSPAVDAALRARMGAAAVTLARAAGYVNAGTVEFILDADGTFAFLEVNARLQVEHPVTELVTGLDLVALQLRIAAGEPLPFGQADVRLTGHALECRVIAEDPAAGFLPSTGRLTAFEPPTGDGVRNDVGVYAGAEVSPYYDSLLAKLIVHAPNRGEALARMQRALARYEVAGVKTNLDLQLAVVGHPAFRAGDLHTGFLAEHHVLEELGQAPPAVLAAASLVEASAVAPLDPWRASNAWRLNRQAEPHAWRVADVQHRVSLSRTLDRTGVVAESGDARVEQAPLGDGHVRVDDDVLTVEAHGAERVVTLGERVYRLRPAPALEATELGRSAGAEAAGSAGEVVAPMPGRVVRLVVAEGQTVAANDPLLVLEAMKMEHVVAAPRAGRVRGLRVAQGEQVAGGATLLEVETESDANAAPR